jgi:hypothetical protein
MRDVAAMLRSDLMAEHLNSRKVVADASTLQLVFN